MPVEHVKVEGLKSLQHALKGAEKDLASELRKTVKSAAKQVADKAKEIARAEGLYDTGALVNSIKAGMQGGAAVVKVTATRNGFQYPAVYEYGRRSPWQNSKGIRTFLEPALDAERASIEADVLKDIDRIINEFSKRGTE